MEDRQSKIDYIYQFINNLGLPNIGNLSSLTQEDQDKTYDCFWEFINKFQREQSIRQEMADK